ncbi:hypothetical protein V6C27_10965 [Peptococcaceae bacterium 1198_IL3148]
MDGEFAGNPAGDSRMSYSSVCETIPKVSGAAGTRFHRNLHLNNQADIKPTKATCVLT